MFADLSVKVCSSSKKHSKKKVNSALMLREEDNSKQTVSVKGANIES